MIVQEVVNYYLNNILYFINKECYILTEKIYCSGSSKNNLILLLCLRVVISKN